MFKQIADSTVIYKHPVVVDPDLNPLIVDALKQQMASRSKIEAHWQKLGGTPGKALSDLEGAGAGYRIRYEHGAIYTGPKGTAWVYGAIGAKYNALGSAKSWLGLPTADEAPFPEGGRVSTFENGAIYWWPDVGAIDLNNVVVHYTGLICFGETTWDQGSDSDEPYVVLGVVSPTGNNAQRTQVYQDVDDGESRPDLVEIYRGKPYGLNISALLMEHDFDDPDRYKWAMAASVETAGLGLSALIGLIPDVGPYLAVAAAIGLQAAKPTLTNELNKLLDTQDDRLGTFTRTLTAKEMVVLAARVLNSEEKGIGYKIASPLISSQGASYKVYFGVVPA